MQQPYDCFVGAPVLQGRGRTRTTSQHRRAKRSDLSALCHEEAKRSDLSRWLMEASCKQASPETNRYFYHPDHLGSSSFITNGAGTAVHHLQYLPFGETFVEQRIRLQPWYTPYKFSAKEKDDETQYSYFGARYYDSDLSVWLSVDPLADKYPNLSPYAYCANNPVMLVDKTGRDHNLIFNDNGDGTGTVTVQATFYTNTRREFRRAQRAVNSLNRLNGQYSYTANNTTYSMGFNINVVDAQAAGFANAQQAAAADPSGNYFEVLGNYNSRLNTGDSFARAAVENTLNNQFQGVVSGSAFLSRYSSNKSCVQEMLHIFGVGTEASGAPQGSRAPQPDNVMASPSYGMLVNRSVLGAILEKSGIGVSNSNDRAIHQRNNSNDRNISVFGLPAGTILNGIINGSSRNTSMELQRKL